MLMLPQVGNKTVTKFTEHESTSSELWKFSLTASSILKFTEWFFIEQNPLPIQHVKTS